MRNYLLFFTCAASSLYAAYDYTTPDYDKPQWYESGDKNDYFASNVQDRADMQSKIRKIDLEMEDIRTQIRASRLRYMKSEVKSEDYLKTEWQQYSQEMKKAENDEDEISKLEKRLTQLQNEKDELLRILKSP